MKINQIENTDMKPIFNDDGNILITKTVKKEDYDDIALGWHYSATTTIHTKNFRTNIIFKERTSRYVGVDEEGLFDTATVEQVWLSPSTPFKTLLKILRLLKCYSNLEINPKVQSKIINLLINKR
jgi:hypothetical protein